MWPQSIPHPLSRVLAEEEIPPIKKSIGHLQLKPGTSYGYKNWDIDDIFNEIVIILWRGGNVRTSSGNIFEQDIESA